MRAWLLLAALTACESSSALPTPYISRVSPALWQLDHPETSLVVTGHGFVHDVRTDLTDDRDPNTTGRFSGTLGGLTLVSITWVTNQLLIVEPPVDLPAGTHQLTIATPTGAEASLAGAVRVDDAPFDLPRLTVNTTADENDITSTPLPGTEGLFLSLREALLIANFLAAETYAIGFDAAVFPADTQNIIAVGSQPLPPITHAGVVIDGFGAGVEISGHNCPGHGLTIRADDVLVRGITIRDFTDGQCVHVAQADSVRLTDNTFLRCDRMSHSSGAQVIFADGDGHEFIANNVLDGGRDGLLLGDAAPTNMLVKGNTVTGHGDDGITVKGRGHILHGNIIESSGGNGIEAGVSENVMVIDNILRANGDGQGAVSGDEEHGIELASIARDWQIADNEFIGNHAGGVHIGPRSVRIAISRCNFRENGEAPIVEGDNPPSIEGFDGTRLTGNASGPGIIELFAVDEATDNYQFVTSTSTTGTWSITLDTPVTAAAVTLTTRAGTSRMSPVHTP